jgi:hypothetical protein
VRAILAAIVLLGGCSMRPPPSGPGTATFDVTGSRGECHSFGGCSYVAILRTDDEVQALDDTHEAELRAFPDPRGSRLQLWPGLPEQIEDGGYTLTFEERLMSDAISNVGPREYGLGATCSRPFTIGPGTSVVMVHVAFPEPTSERRICSISLAIDPAA